MTRTTAEYRRVVSLMGIDAADRTYWAWEWDDGEAPGFAVVERYDALPVLTRLAHALPGSGDPSAPSVAGALGGSTRDAMADAIQRCKAGELADPEAERRLAVDLGTLLLPRALTDRIQRYAPAEVLVRVLPPSSCIRVPWEILAVDGTHAKRLVEIADVEMMAPLLRRDGDRSRQHPSWASLADDRRPLWVIDPVRTADDGKHGVLSSAQAKQWRLRAASGNAQIHRHVMDRSTLSEHLLAAPSRLFYLGHVEADAPSAANAALVMADSDDSLYSPSRPSARTEGLLTAQDLLVGTTRAAAEVTADRVPAAAREGERVVAIPGDGLWPMPPRVALIACQSGTDLGHVEPFGLVTALLELGAELVTATRWPLFTDAAYSPDGVSGTATPFDELAERIDQIHEEDDPVRLLNCWQRERLDRWRHHPSWAGSPLSWAAVTNHHAPDRTDRTTDGPRPLE